ncbi:MAG: protein kinase, partial [Pseudonocardia sp.]
MTFGPYQLMSLLGRGGMGDVWRAFDTRRGREVALKVLPPGIAGHPDLSRRFRREAELAARISAPHVVPIHDWGDIDGRLFIDMALIRGDDLETLLRAGPLTPDRAVDVVGQTAQALDAAHDAGLLHRDVKPSNVVVTRSGDDDFVYLIDFGIAHLVDATKSATGALTGTLAYMAPERFDGAGDRRSDVYSLAAVLCEALTGRAPFVPPTGAYPLAYFLQAHSSSPPPRPSDRDPHLPHGLDDVVCRGLAKAPSDRFATAGALAAAARAALQLAPAPPRPVPSSPRAGASATLSVPEARPIAEPADTAPPMVERPVPAPPDTTPPVTAPPDTAPPMVERPVPAPPDTTPPVTERPITAPPDTAPPIPAPGTTRTAATPARARRSRLRLGLAMTLAVIVAAGIGFGVVSLTGVQAGQLVGAPLVGHTDFLEDVATTQVDGRTVLVSTDFDGSLRRWNLATQEPVGQPIQVSDGPAGGLAVTDLDGRPVAVTGAYDNTVREWDLATGAPLTPPLTGHTGAIQDVAVADLDGRPVAVTGGNDATVRVWDLRSGSAVGTPITGSGKEVFAVATAQLDGRPVIVSGGLGDDVHLWDLATHAAVGA